MIYGEVSEIDVANILTELVPEQCRDCYEAEVSLKGIATQVIIGSHRLSLDQLHKAIKNPDEIGFTCCKPSPSRIKIIY